MASSYFEGMTMPGHVYLGHVGSESVLNDMRSRPLPGGVILGHDGEQFVQLVCMIASTKLYFIILIVLESTLIGMNLLLINMLISKM